jgi:hypothetical protein
MLLNLIEHQEELFAAIIAPVSYRELNALRVSCKALFDTISGAHRWQHMRKFAASLRQINSIYRVILDDGEGNYTTVIRHKNNITCYVSLKEISVLEIYHNRFTYDIDIIGTIIHYEFINPSLYKFSPDTFVPQWLYECVADFELLSNGYETIIDVRP